MTQINASFSAPPLLLERIYLCEDPFDEGTALLSAKAGPSSGGAKAVPKPKEEIVFRQPKMANNKWLQTAATIAALAAAEERVQHFFSATRRIKSEFIGQFAALGDLVDFKESILDNPLKFTDEVPELSASVPLGEQLSFLLRQSHLLLVNDLCAAVELFKGMPAAALLQKQDMVNLTSNLGMALVGFCERYHSSRWESPVVVKLSNGFSPMLFANELPRENKKLRSTAELLFRQTMWRFNALKLDSEEFLLLRAIVMSHSALDGISQQGRRTLQRESERYAGALLHHLQTRLGQMGGVQRFGALLSLVECVLRTGPIHRRYHAQMDAHLDAPLSRTVPRCLLTICTGEGDQTQEMGHDNDNMKAMKSAFTPPL